MMTGQRLFIALLLIALLVGCQVTSQTPYPSPSPNPVQSSPSPLPVKNTPTVMQPAPIEVIPPTLTPTAPPTLPAAAPTAFAGPSLAALTIDWSVPFAPMQVMGVDITLTEWQAQPYTGRDLSLPLSLDQVANLHVLDGLTSNQKTFLVTNGFVVIHSQEAQFGDIRVATSKETGQPYFLTTDAAFHALHLLFDDMLKAVEREYFRPRMLEITIATLSQVGSASSQLQGSSIEADAHQALAYLSVALKLLDPQAEIDPSVAQLVSQQVDQIMSANGRAQSVIFPDFEDDYGAYLPVGHYAGDPELEAYFRCMTWFGRVHFLLHDPSNPGFVPSRLPLIVTLAMRIAQVDGEPASDLWAEVHKTLTFVVGPSDDAGPLEYSALMDQVYGAKLQMQDLADQSAWEEFLSRSDQLPSPQINSLFVASTIDLTGEKGWRFMGQRFTLDGMLMQNVIFDKVKEKPDGSKRALPSGLDVMAAFGSLPAYQQLELQGVTRFPNYIEQMASMQQAVQAQPQEQWLGRFYDSWLYAFLPVVQPKDSSFPAYMQTAAWSYKDLNAALGSWAELKHDTILYTKMPEMAGGGGPPMSGPAPSYVEPDPEAFFRMAYMARSLSCGLQDLVLHQPCFLEGMGYGGYGDAAQFITNLGALGDRFELLGAIAAKELAGLPLDEYDNAAITECLGMNECVNEDTGYKQPTGEMPKVPVIAAVSGAGQDVLSVGVGSVDRIYVVVPLEDQWEIAQGGIFSYYEFSQPRSQRLTDEAWREQLASGNVSLPAWASSFILPGGQSNSLLFFRVGDVYIVTEAGDKLNVRDNPSLSGNILTQVRTDTYVEIVDGPVQADGYTWWKFSMEDWTAGTQITGWAVENQHWYVRSYHP